jgi:hypothetical protein
MAVANASPLIACLVVHCLRPQFVSPPTWHACSVSFPELYLEVVLPCRLGDSVLLRAMVCLFVGLLCVLFKFHSQVCACALLFWACSWGPRSTHDTLFCIHEGGDLGVWWN